MQSTIQLQQLHNVECESRHFETPLVYMFLINGKEKNNKTHFKQCNIFRQSSFPPQGSIGILLLCTITAAFYDISFKTQKQLLSECNFSF